MATKRRKYGPAEGRAVSVVRCGFQGKKTKTKNYTIICPDPVAAAIFPSVKRPPEAVPGTSSTGLYLYFDGTSSQVEEERERQESYKILRILSCSLGRSR